MMDTHNARPPAPNGPPPPIPVPPMIADEGFLFGRGALASCLVMVITSWAARMEIPIDALEVEVQADFDARGELGVGEARARYSQVRYEIAIDSPAPKDAVVGLLDVALRRSPYVDVFARAQTMHRAVRLNGQEI